MRSIGRCVRMSILPFLSVNTFDNSVSVKTGQYRQLRAHFPFGLQAPPILEDLGQGHFMQANPRFPLLGIKSPSGFPGFSSS